MSVSGQSVSTVTVGATWLYGVFDMAEKKNMTVAKLLTGKDAPLTNLELALRNTFAIATQRFREQAE